MHVKGVGGDAPEVAFGGSAVGEDEPEIAVWRQFYLEKLEGGHGAEIQVGEWGARLSNRRESRARLLRAVGGSYPWKLTSGYA